MSEAASGFSLILSPLFALTSANVATWTEELNDIKNVIENRIIFLISSPN